MESIMEKSVTTNIKNYMKQLKVANANLELERERFRTLINEYSRNSHSLDIEMVTQNAKALERVQKEIEMNETVIYKLKTILVCSEEF